MDPLAALFLLLILIVLALAYLQYQVQKISRSLFWILTHVKVVSKSDEKDPELKNIKKIFGVEEEGEQGK